MTASASVVDDATGTAYGPGDLLTTAQAADLLGIDASHVRRLCRAHGLGVKLGDRFAAVTVADVERLRGLLIPGRGRPKKA